MTEQLLDLTQVCVGPEKLRREDVPERVRRDAFPLCDAGRVRLAQGRLLDRLREPPPMHADDERRLAIARLCRLGSSGGIAAV